jgi:hypothetical protein
VGEQIGDSSNDLWHSVFNGTAWSANVKIPGQQSKAPPALAFFGGAIHMVHLGDTSNDLWHPVYGTASSGSAAYVVARIVRRHQLRSYPAGSIESDQKNHSLTQDGF